MLIMGLVQVLGLLTYPVIIFVIIPVAWMQLHLLKPRAGPGSGSCGIGPIYFLAGWCKK